MVGRASGNGPHNGGLPQPEARGTAHQHFIHGEVGPGLITDPDTTLCDGKGATLSVWTERVERKLLTERKA